MTDAELLRIQARAWEEYEGDVSVLASAIGALFLGREIGWHGLRLMYSRVTFNKYEKILGVKFKEKLPERTPGSERMNGIRLANDIGKFWQVVAGGMVSAREAAQTVK